MLVEYKTWQDLLPLILEAIQYWKQQWPGNGANRRTHTCLVPRPQETKEKGLESGNETGYTHKVSSWPVYEVNVKVNYCAQVGYKLSLLWNNKDMSFSLSDGKKLPGKRLFCQLLLLSKVYCCYINIGQTFPLISGLPPTLPTHVLAACTCCQIWKTYCVQTPTLSWDHHQYSYFHGSI